MNPYEGKALTNLPAAPVAHPVHARGYHGSLADHVSWKTAMLAPSADFSVELGGGQSMEARFLYEAVEYEEETVLRPVRPNCAVGMAMEHLTMVSVEADCCVVVILCSLG